MDGTHTLFSDRRGQRLWWRQPAVAIPRTPAVIPGLAHSRLGATVQTLSLGFLPAVTCQSLFTVLFDPRQCLHLRLGVVHETIAHALASSPAGGLHAVLRPLHSGMVDCQCRRIRVCPLGCHRMDDAGAPLAAHNRQRIRIHSLADGMRIPTFPVLRSTGHGRDGAGMPPRPAPSAKDGRCSSRLRNCPASVRPLFQGLDRDNPPHGLSRSAQGILGRCSLGTGSGPDPANTDHKGI